MKKHLEELTEKRRVFFNDFISHYNITNRGIEEGEGNNCSYSAGCAIGRVIEKKLAQELDEKHGNPSVRIIFHLLPMELQELGQDFLQEIQHIHDSSSNYDRQGLSDFGKYEANNFMEKWGI